MTDEKNKSEDAVVKLRSAVLTDVGVVREHNEDSAMMDEHQRFFVVADGMGGHAAGEVASAMAVEGIATALSSADSALTALAEQPSEEARQNVAQILEEAVREAHRAVFERGVSEPDKQGMGTTLDVLLLSGQEAFIAHVGDSRTYLMRGGAAAQITTDHTVAEVLVIEGKLSAEEALVSPLRTILVNALGVAAEVGVEMAHLTLQTGDRILMCSDGLHDYFPKEQELFKLVMSQPPEDALIKLIDIAKKEGGHDNITAIIIEVLKAPEVVEVSTIPIPIMRAASDGVPYAIAKDDTVPVDGRADTPPSASVVPIVAKSDSSEASKSDDDRRSTVPIRMPGSRSRKQTVEGVGVTGTGDSKMSGDKADSGND